MLKRLSLLLVVLVFGNGFWAEAIYDPTWERPILRAEIVPTSEDMAPIYSYSKGELFMNQRLIVSSL